MQTRKLKKKKSRHHHSTCTKGKKIEMVAETAEKMPKKGKGTEKDTEFDIDSNIFAKTLHSQAKKATISQFGRFWP